MQLERVTLFCFEASYAVALGLELAQMVWPRVATRWLGIAFGGAGLFAHTLFLLYQQPPLSSPFGSILFLAWILAVFYFYGSLHHRRVTWGVFVLPVVLGLIGLADQNRLPREAGRGMVLNVDALRGDHFWGLVHGGLLLLAAVGVTVGFLASLMYLVQAHRLKAKVLPGEGMQLLSLERLEQMNRRAINWAFPLLTAGVLVGMVLMIQQPREALFNWKDPRILGTVILWLVYAILLYLRYGFHLRGRRVALLTIVAFGLLLVTLASTHTSVTGGNP